VTCNYPCPLQYYTQEAEGFAVVCFDTPPNSDPASQQQPGLARESMDCLSQIQLEDLLRGEQPRSRFVGLALQAGMIEGT
jgi:hypothetical protein